MKRFALVAVVALVVVLVVLLVARTRPSDPVATPAATTPHAETAAKITVVIVPGMTILDVAAVLASSDVVSKDVFLGAATNPTTVQQCGVTAHTLEGYIFPGEYEFSARTEIGAVLTQFNRLREKIFNTRYRTIESPTMDRHLGIVIASLATVEADSREEREAFVRRTLERRVKKEPGVFPKYTAYLERLRSFDRAYVPPATMLMDTLVPAAPVGAPDLDVLEKVFRLGREERYVPAIPIILKGGPSQVAMPTPLAQ